MQFLTFLRTTSLLLASLVLAACASTRPVMEWRDEGFSGQLNHILVIAATEQKTQRHSMEDGYVEALGAVPVKAVASYSLMQTDSPLSRETVEAAIEGQGFDAVLVTSLLGVEEVEQYVPPTHHDYYRGYHRYYRRSLSYSSSGHYRKFKVLTLESNLYDTATGDLVWSIQSETIDASVPEDVIEAQITITIDKLTQAGLIGEKQ